MSPITPAFDETIHAPLRLKACVQLSTVQQMAFSALRDDLGVADSVLSKQLKVLVDAGYATTTAERGERGRPRKWLRLTRAGRRAFDGHVAALRDLTGEAGSG